MTESTRRQFSSFKRGFHFICSEFLNMCRASELELLLCGTTTTDIDFRELAQSCTYMECDKNDNFIIDFWDIVSNDFTLQQRRMLLLFVTSSDRVPLKGLGKITFCIQKNGSDTDRLPTAMTCFGRLLLPDYGSREYLKNRLILAIENAKGFGLV